MTKIIIDVTELANAVAEVLDMSDREWEQLDKGVVPIGWSNAVLDQLEYNYELETKLMQEIVK